METITLHNRIESPQVGLGTYLLEPDDAQASVTYALDNGYTLIDTANVYVNERAVGRGMRALSCIVFFVLTAAPPGSSGSSSRRRACVHTR